jgi:hypothetical protein
MKKFPLSFLLFLVITPFLKAIAASGSPYEDSPDSIEPPPPAPIDEYVYVLFIFGIGLMLYHFYKSNKKNALDKV